VRFSDCVQELLREPSRALLEVGPGQTLVTLARQHLSNPKERILISSIRHPKEQTSDIAFILGTLGKLWLARIQPDWPGFYRNEKRRRVPLPTYPFERQRYWVDPLQQPDGIPASQASVGKGEGEIQSSIHSEFQIDDHVSRDQELGNDYVARSEQ
jgi:acyl transferase domain-containing protein